MPTPWIRGVRDQVAQAVNQAVVEAPAQQQFPGQGRQLDLRPYVLRYGPDAVARATGLPVGRVRAVLERNINRLPNTSITDPSGVTLIVRGIDGLLREALPSVPGEPAVAGMFPGFDPEAVRRSAEAEMFLAARRQAERDALLRARAAAPMQVPIPGVPAGEPLAVPVPAGTSLPSAEGGPVGEVAPGLPPGSPPELPPAEPQFIVPNLGITYVRVPYDDGTFVVKVVRPPVPNSPAAGLGRSPATWCSNWTASGSAPTQARPGPHTRDDHRVDRRTDQ